MQDDSPKKLNEGDLCAVSSKNQTAKISQTETVNHLFTLQFLTKLDSVFRNIVKT